MPESRSNIRPIAHAMNVQHRKTEKVQLLGHQITRKHGRHFSTPNSAHDSQKGNQAQKEARTSI